MNCLSRLTTLNLDLGLENRLNPIVGGKKKIFLVGRKGFILVTHDKKYPVSISDVTVPAFKAVHMSEGFWEGC